MSLKEAHTGFAIAIAWPETYCKQPGYWYDGILNFLNISKNHYYKIGHAALVLINTTNKECLYFDFGRYHTPFQHGRVRSALTDDGLRIKTIPEISDNGKEILNYNDILTELQLNHECHGEGKLYASYCQINFERSLSKAKDLQEKSPIKYGPFKYKGSNCSRFVNDTIMAGKPNWSYIYKLKYFVPLTPTPLNNVDALNHKTILPKMLSNKPFCPFPIIDKSVLKNTLPQAELPKGVPNSAQWLSGEGAGSWFSIITKENNYLIKRFDSDGGLECEGIFENSNNISFDLNEPFEFIHLSHCRNVKIMQNKVIVSFLRIR